MIQRNAARALPSLESGDRMSRDEFERRYECRPDIKRAELIDGVVFVSSPVRFSAHASPHGLLVTWGGTYAVRTPGVLLGDNGTVRLGPDSEVQPDLMLAWDGAHGGQATLDDSEDGDDYIEGAPEFAAEVAASSVSIDLHRKKDAYRRAGVREYVVWAIEDSQLYWFRLEGEEYREIAPDAEGRIESVMFPGLRLDVAALLRRDGAAVLAALA